MNAVVLGIDKPVEIDRKENLRDHRLYWIGRRTQDVILSAAALVVLSPVMLATAVAIVVDDPVQFSPFIVRYEQIIHYHRTKHVFIITIHALLNSCFMK